MNIGKLRAQVSIYKNVTTKDEMGGRSTEWVLHAKRWAEILRPRFVSGVIQGAVATDITQGIKIRDLGDINIGWEVRYKGKVYKILHVDNSKVGETVLTLREVVISG